MEPVRLEAELDHPNRWLWLVKWLLVIPHALALFFLWIAFVVLTVVAFVAILFTGRYPPTIFEFNRGVLRWSWRVVYYSYGVLGTDRYPPFTLADVPDYPARLDIEPPGPMSRGLVLVKWWLLAIPHYLVLGVLIGGGIMVGGDDDRRGAALAGLLVLFAAIALLFTAGYPRGIFDLLVGVYRWGFRVAAYAFLMTDRYPPFRLDQGGLHLPAAPPPGEPGEPTAAETPAAETPAAETPAAEPPPGDAPPPGEVRAHGWTGGAIASVLIGSIAVALGLAALAGGGVATTADRARGADGYVRTDFERALAPGYALTMGDVEISGNAVGAVRDWVGEIQIEARGPGRPLFLGVAPRAEADRYLAGVGYDRVTHLPFRRGNDDLRLRHHSGGAPATPPGGQTFWAASTGGTGTQRLTWQVQPGDWRVVVMNADGSAPIAADLRIGATLPHLDQAAAALWGTGAALLAIGAALVALALRMASRHRRRAGPGEA